MLERPGRFIETGDTLVLLGDSITASANGYAKLLADTLGTKGITVINAGIGGDKTVNALMRLRADVIERKPAAVSIFLGTNDAAVGNGIWADEPRIPAAAYATNLAWIIHICRLAGIKKFSVTPPVLFEGQPAADYGDVLRDYQLAARRVAEDTRAHFVPADAAFADEWRRHPGHTGLLLTTDGTHMTARGNEVLAQCMLSAWRMLG